jgi:hypothetical protein
MQIVEVFLIENQDFTSTNHSQSKIDVSKLGTQIEKASNKQYPTESKCDCKQEIQNNLNYLVY